MPWYPHTVENLSLSALIYLRGLADLKPAGWESFIISLDILTHSVIKSVAWLRIFHYQPWYTYYKKIIANLLVENLSLSALIYLGASWKYDRNSWESFIISLDILTVPPFVAVILLRIFHYQPWYTYSPIAHVLSPVENLSLSALIYLPERHTMNNIGWESFIISLDILNRVIATRFTGLRIFHYQPWYT